MIDNVGRKVFWIVVFLLAAISSLLVPEKPFRMGLDLQGGTRLVYRFDPVPSTHLTLPPTPYV